ncbi:MAG: hypoxanthine phosphoribosyltransferase [Alphaproteobacteria bacterium]|nr:MAG: hypoxanthine phosphoribosyltransferase [Alphaproteobacteria bacterium]
MTEFSSKVFIRAQQLLEDSFRLGFKILESDFRPRFIIGVWRGGAPTGIAIQELLDFYGVETDHISIRTSSYVGMEQQKTVRVHGLDYILNNVNAEDDLLIVDDVFDSGRSIEAIVETLQEKSRRNMPERVRIATVYYKPLRNKTKLAPDFFLHETDEWLVFPHELHGLTMEEIRQHKGLSLDFPEPVSEKSKVRREA